MKVVLCGYNWIGCKALDLLMERGHEVFVYTHENPPYVNSMVDLCRKKGVPFSLQKISKGNLPFVPEVICSIYYRHIIGQAVIDACQKRIFNLHPSLLPNYKGCSSLTWAMIEGESFAGYTYHYIDSGIDTGNIILQAPVRIEDFDTQLSLYQRVMHLAAADFFAAFDLVVSGFEGMPQSTSGTYFKRGAPHDGVISENWDLEKTERFVRAMNCPPLPYARFKGLETKTFEEFLVQVTSA